MNIAGIKYLTPFQRKVYKIVQGIPVGDVRTYKWVAKRIGNPKSARAVGLALKKNPFTIIVPCHRIVHSDDSIGEYALGRDIKKRLLDVEGVDVRGDKIKIRNSR